MLRTHYDIVHGPEGKRSYLTHIGRKIGPCSRQALSQMQNVKSVNLLMHILSWKLRHLLSWK